MIRSGILHIVVRPCQHVVLGQGASRSVTGLSEARLKCTCCWAQATFEQPGQ